MINTTYTNSLVNSCKYKHSDRVKKDLQVAQTNFSNLPSSLGVYIYKNFYGHKRELVKLDGTIPITYKGKTYNIPILIWIPENYPSSPPDCFIVPTANMVIKPSKYIDMDGKIYLPYFKDWKSSHDLTSAIQVMQAVFAEYCPVFSQNTGGSMHQPTPQANPQNYNPNLPHSFNTNVQSTGFAPYPVNPNQIQFPNPTNLPYPVNPNFVPHPSPTQNHQQYITAHNQDPYSSINNHASPIDPEAIKQSLISVLKDKINIRLKDTFERAQVEMDNLLKTKQRLLDGAIVIQNISNMLDNETKESEKQLTELEDALAKAKIDAKKFVNEDNHENDPKNENDGNDEYAYLDEAVNATTPIYKQILEAVAEENATIDAMYYLREALKHHAISLDDFLKNIRDLSRKQFTLKIIIYKARTAAGLPV